MNDNIMIKSLFVCVYLYVGFLITIYIVISMAAAKKERKTRLTAAMNDR